MKTDRKIITFLFLFAGLASPGLKAEEIVQTPAAVAKIGAAVLTEPQMRKDLGMSLYEAENNLYQLKKNWVDQQTKNILFEEAAKEAGLPRQAWQKREIEVRVTPPTQQDVDQWAPRFAPRGSTAPLDAVQLAQMKQQATQMLVNQRRSMRENEVYRLLLQKNPLEILFTKPEQPRIEVTYGPDAPVKGPKDAPITLMEFTDFQCPYCKGAVNTLHQIEAAYPGKIKIVARQNPLALHQRARPSAEAAFCAKEQGKFWEYREKLFANQSQLEEADFRRYAKELGLSEKKFDKCLTEHRHAAKIDADLAEGQRYGVRGTPHFFINGRPISGAQPYDNFKAVIDDELAKKR